MVAGLLRPRLLGAHALLTSDDGDGALIFLLEGSAQAVTAGPHGGPVVLGDVGPGALLGVTALDGDAGRRVAIVTREPVRFLELDKARWRALVGETSDVGSALRSAMIRASGMQLAEAPIDVGG